MYRSRKNKAKSGKKRPIFLMIVVVLVLTLAYGLWSKYHQKLVFEPNTTISIAKGETLAKFYADQKGLQKFMTKLWIRNNSNLVPKLQEGSYLLSGSYTKAEFLQHLAEGPKQEFTRITLLEGWSMYDTDAYLTKKGLINEGSYIQKVQDQQFISAMRSEFSFLAILPEGKSLEGFLYPDTYFLSQQGVVLEQLLKAQLKNFDEKVWKQHREDFLSFAPKDLPLNNYAALVLASVIENEEKNLNNKPVIAGIFINRISQGMRLDADVSLCYGLKITYDQCRAAIVPNLDDASNLYNTRKNIGLPPTPISSPSLATINALFRYRNTDAIYYLHDAQGNIHYGMTLEEHNANKAKYL